MTDYEYFCSLVEYRCMGCPAYEYLGHCGSIQNCTILELDDFLAEMGWYDEDLPAEVFFRDCILPEIFQTQDECDEAMMAEDEDIPGMWDYEDEPFYYM